MPIDLNVDDLNGWRPIETLPFVEYSNSREDFLVAKIDERYGPIYKVAYMSNLGMIPYINATHWMPIKKLPQSHETA